MRSPWELRRATVTLLSAFVPSRRPVGALLSSPRRLGASDKASLVLPDEQLPIGIALNRPDRGFAERDRLVCSRLRAQRVRAAVRPRSLEGQAAALPGRRPGPPDGPGGGGPPARRGPADEVASVLSISLGPRPGVDKCLEDERWGSASLVRWTIRRWPWLSASATRATPFVV